jgi:hypothetical protein
MGFFLKLLQEAQRKNLPPCDVIEYKTRVAITFLSADPNNDGSVGMPVVIFERLETYCWYVSRKISLYRRLP